MNEYNHVFVWGNNEKRKTLKGRICRTLAHGRMNSILIQFENGQKEIVSRYSVRKVKNENMYRLRD